MIKCLAVYIVDFACDNSQKIAKAFRYFVIGIWFRGIRSLFTLAYNIIQQNGSRILKY